MLTSNDVHKIKFDLAFSFTMASICCCERYHNAKSKVGGCYKKSVPLLVGFIFYL